MRQPAKPAGRVRAVVRRVVRRAGGGSGWPPIAGASLGLLGVAEAVLRADGSGVILPIAILVALCATVPLTFASSHPAAATVTVTAAGLPVAAVFRGPTVTGLGALFTVWFLLIRRRVRRLRAEAAERNTSRQAIENRLMEFTARGERARIARELHDVVAHHISMISVQAETARLAVPGMPEEGAKRLLAIGETARTALTEMRRLLGVLREDAGTEPTRRPQPGLQQLLELVDETRDSARASARLIVRGQVAALDPGIELTAYRIVQEALTNVRRHAPGAAVDVELTYTSDALHLRVRDNGPGPPPGAGNSGHGRLGMQERAASVGGELRTGPAPVSGFLVDATLPLAGIAGFGAS